jgi:hypothetical protein
MRLVALYKAVDLIVAESRELQKRRTTHSIAFNTSSQRFSEEYYAQVLVEKASLFALCI